jgi:SIR2-like domain
MAIDLNLVTIPQVPAGLREAAVIGRLIPFIGAGASRLAGCPGWADFADGALHQLVDKGKFTHAQLDQIRHLSPRIKLSIATSLSEDAKTPIDFEALLHRVPRTKHPEGRRLYNSLFALGNIFVTTNYDRWLDERIAEPAPRAVPAASPSTPSHAISMHSVYKANEFLPALLTQSNTVVHLHGSVGDRNSMILTTRDYIRQYANDHRTGDGIGENRTLTFLEHLFSHYTVLFVGYGLEELEILEYVILKARRQLDTVESEARHFLLQGFFSHEATLLRHMEAYYSHECGIQLIPFLRDHKDHNQLLEVLEDFAQRIPSSGPLMLQQEQVLEDLAREMELLP